MGHIEYIKRKLFRNWHGTCHFYRTSCHYTERTHDRHSATDLVAEIIYILFCVSLFLCTTLYSRFPQ